LRGREGLGLVGRERARVSVGFGVWVLVLVAVQSKQTKKTEREKKPFMPSLFQKKEIRKKT
jgi:hypothetical protein